MTVENTCNLLGYTRQNYYKHLKVVDKSVDKKQVLSLVHTIRKKMPRLGTRKLYSLLSPEIRGTGIKCGRDKLFMLLKEHDLLIIPRKRYVQTTMSRHWLRKHPNTYKNLKLTKPEQAWVTDITYIKTDEGNCYLTLITDAYSRKIMGYNLADNMAAEESVKALKMAIKSRRYKNTIIHHSDRGLQFCSKEYVGMAEKNKIIMSMTEKYDPYENALAERMNRIIKEEFYLDGKLKNKTQVQLIVKESVDIYNTLRPHLSLNFKTPENIHKNPHQNLLVGNIF